MAKSSDFTIRKTPVTGDGTNESDVLPTGKIVSSTVGIVVPVPATRAQIMEWFCHGLGMKEIGADNPLAGHTLIVAGDPDLVETEYSVHPVANLSDKDG